MSPLKAYQVALYSEKKAFAFYGEALRYVDQPEVKALFEELRDEEAEHVRMLEKIIAKLPPSAEIELEDEDADPEDTRAGARKSDRRTSPSSAPMPWRPA